jgi:arylsulfatase A-like enzyme
VVEEEGRLDNTLIIYINGDNGTAGLLTTRRQSINDA